ncbi:MAG: NAD-dependent epimerase/dehydratase family protein [Actinomycetota bacterium]|nr:NAD-dependent epimerase/dehydratase family protein [Actinomycetota bacterium]
MKALVTGGAGFIGAAIARGLVDRGDDVVIVDDFSAGREDAVPRGTTLVVADIRDTDAVASACGNVEVIFHHAAVKSVPRSMDEPMVANDVNAAGTLSVLQAAESAGVKRLIYASSSSVYGGSDGSPSHEDDSPNPLSPYAVSKLAGEYYCRVWSGLGRVPTVTLRYFNVFGPGQPADSRYAAVFPAFITALQAGEAPVIYGDGEQTRDFTFIDDIVRANVLAADAEASVDGAVINAAGGDPRTVNDVFTTISRVLGSSVAPEHADPRPGDIRHSLAEPARGRDLLGWKPETEWDAAVAATVDWFRTR